MELDEETLGDISHSSSLSGADTFTDGSGRSQDSSKRRISTRSIKRKKFDDEVVESSLTPAVQKFSRRGVVTSALEPRATLPMTLIPQPNLQVALSPLHTSITAALLNQPSTSSPPIASTSIMDTSSPTGLSVGDESFSNVTPTGRSKTAALSSPSGTGPLTSSPVDPGDHPSSPQDAPLSPPPPSLKPAHAGVGESGGSREKKKRSSKKSKKPKPPPPASHKDLGRWKAQDDLLLITAVQQSCDLNSVFLGCKFSCTFTKKEIEERWYALLYDPILSKLAVQAMKQLHPDTVAQVQAKSLFSKEEEQLLSSISSVYFMNSPPQLEPFQKLLEDNPTVFHASRTAKVLLHHWTLLRQYHLLPDQTVQPAPRGDHVLNFSDAEEQLDDNELRETRNEVIEHELAAADRMHKREIRRLESDVKKWQVMVDVVTGIGGQEFDPQTLAVLRGRLVRYLMRSKEITIGRSAVDNSVDVDLSLEGPSGKVSRKQGTVKLKNNGDFYLINEGKRAMIVEGRPVVKGSKVKLNNNAVIEISCLRFVFLINEEVIDAMRQDAGRSQPQQHPTS